MKMIFYCLGTYQQHALILLLILWMISHCPNGPVRNNVRINFADGPLSGFIFNEAFM